MEPMFKVLTSYANLKAYDAVLRKRTFNRKMETATVISPAHSRNWLVGDDHFIGLFCVFYYSLFLFTLIWELQLPLLLPVWSPKFTFWLYINLIRDLLYLWSQTCLVKWGFRSWSIVLPLLLNIISTSAV